MNQRKERQLRQATIHARPLTPKTAPERDPASTRTQPKRRLLKITNLSELSVLRFELEHQLLRRRELLAGLSGSEQNRNEQTMRAVAQGSMIRGRGWRSHAEFRRAKQQPTHQSELTERTDLFRLREHALLPLLRLGQIGHGLQTRAGREER
jgi:hypothetical protein